MCILNNSIHTESGQAAMLECRDITWKHSNLQGGVPPPTAEILQAVITVYSEFWTRQKHKSSQNCCILPPFVMLWAWRSMSFPPHLILFSYSFITNVESMRICTITNQRVHAAKGCALDKREISSATLPGGLFKP